MIRIRVGDQWRHDPAVRAALRRAEGRARAEAALRIVDVLALEVDGVDIAAGRTEGALLPSLEALLRGVASLLGGAAQAAVAFDGGEVELVLRRRGACALLSVVSLGRPARVLARDVEVDLEALAAAALAASADLVRELAAAEPGAAASGPARRLRDAARRLRAAEARPPRAPRPAGPRRPPALARPGAIACTVQLADEEAVLDGYRGGGAPDLASLLAAGRVALRAADGREVLSVAGAPFLLLRDLAAAADGIVAAARRGDAAFAFALAPPGRGAPLRVEVDLARGTVSGGGAAAPCRPLDLARALLDAAAAFARDAAARHPRQAENPYLAELAAAAREGLAHLAELSAGDLVARTLPARAAPPRPASPRPLGPGRLRRIAFRRTAELDVGAPAGDGLLATGGVVTAAGAAGVAALDPATGTVLWRGDGAEVAHAVPGALLLLRAGELACVAPRTGRARWARPWAGGPVRGAAAFARGPLVVLEAAGATALDPATGRTLWRFEPAAASRIAAATFGGVLVAGADTALVYGVDAAGGVAFRVRAPGPVLWPPRAGAGAALLVAGAGPAASLVALDAASGARRWEAPLDLGTPEAIAVGGGRALVAGTLGGDPIVACVARGGRVLWTVAPALAGPVAATLSGAEAYLQDRSGAVVALGPDGAARWSHARPPSHPPPGPLAPAVARGTVISGADGLVALDAASGEVLGAAPDVAPVRLALGAGLEVVALEADGAVVALRLGTHLSLL